MPDNEELDGVKFSEFPSQTPGNSDEVVGLHSGGNARFSIANIVAAVRNGLASIFVPKSDVGAANGVASLDSTGKVPSIQLPPIASTAADVTYDNTGSGLTADDVQDAIDEVYGDIPAQPSDIGAQPSITANGILKGDGAGGVSAATAGTDYQAPLTIDTTPTASSTNPVQSGGVYTDVRTRVPNYGKGINIFDNPWFTVNQRGVVSGTAVNAEYFLSRWVIRRASYSISGHTVTVTATANEYGIYQPMKLGTLVTGEKYTISADIDGEIKSLTFTMPSATGYVGYLSANVRIYIQISASSVNVWFTIPTANASFAISKAKIELGEETTLEGDIEPNNEAELIKCQTSTADPSDTYANKSLATRQDLTSIQATGTTNTTGAAIPAGAYFYLNGVLHRAKTQIDQNATFTVNTNCVSANVMDSWANRHIVCYEGTAPINTTAYSVAIPAISAEASILLGISLKHTNNMWYDHTRETTSFSMLPFINGSELRFTFTSSGATNFGGNPYKAYILTT